MSEPEPLESPAHERFADPLQSFGHVARVAYRAFSQVLARRIDAYGITIGQWRFLRELWREDGITQRELSGRLGMREPSTVAAVRSLEEAGLVRRRRCDSDRRRNHVHLTAKAKRLREPLLEHVAAVNALATAGIPERELELARRVFLQMAAQLEDAVDGEPLAADSEV